MKIAIVSTMMTPVPAVLGGAVQQLITDLIENNEKNKISEIDLYTAYHPKLKEYKYKYTNIIYKKIGLLKKIIQKIINKLLRILKINYIFDFQWEYAANYIRNKKYDYIIIENNMFMYKKVYKRYNGKTKFIYHMHNDINNCDKTPENYKFIEKSAYKILVVSNFIKDRLIKIKKTDKIEVLYNCIDLTLFEKKLDKKYIEKMNTKIPKGKVKILYIGRFSKEKGLLELIKAFNSIKSNNSVLLIAGEEINLKLEYHRTIINEINKNSENIVLLGKIDYKFIPEVYSIGNIQVIPTICEEAFGMVALESILMKKVIIATDSGGMVEVLDGIAILVNKEENFIFNLTNALLETIQNYDNIKNKINETYNKKINYKYLEKYDKEKYLENLFIKIKK